MEQNYFYPETYGAVGDGVQNDVKALQAALDDAEHNGGGTVVLSSGKTYYSDSLQLRKNVELHLMKGARLKATRKPHLWVTPLQASRRLYSFTDLKQTAARFRARA